MCQLSLIDFRDRKLNQIALHQLFMENTKTTNRDGFGLFTGTEINKSQHGADIIIDFGTWIPKLVTALPVIAHVRLATAVNNVKTINRESSHPFETDKIVLAHNGMLEYKDKENYKKHKDITVDTQLFMNELSDLYDGTNMVDAIQKTMELFYGTFAFLIYSKLESKYFVVRGNTKKLHVSKIKFMAPNTKTERSGILVNTDKLDLSSALRHMKAIVEIAYPGTVFVYDDPIELKAETIYGLEKQGLAELGTVKEVGKPAVNFTPAPQTGNHTTIPNYGTNTSGGNIGAVSAITEELNLLLDNYALTLIEFDSICYSLLNKGFFACDRNELKSLVTICRQVFAGNYTEGKGKLWTKLSEQFTDPMFIYSTFPWLKFPYLMNSLQNLDRAIKELDKNEKAQ